MTLDVIGFEDGERHLSWAPLLEAFENGHTRPRAKIDDTFLFRDPDTLLSRCAWINGLGLAVKSATIFPENKGLDCSSINGAVSLFSDKTGELDAIIDFHLVTKWKTAADSLLASKYLAPTEMPSILLVGAGTVAASMISAYTSLFPNAEISVWARSAEKASEFATHHGIKSVANLAAAVPKADIICTATMTQDPVIKGDWLRPGQHLDLIGAYRPDMREVDDLALQRARVFVDSIETTLDHIGELKIPLRSGAIQRDHVVADYYDLKKFTREKSDITIAKNGGGAHLDLMTCRFIVDAYRTNS